MSRREKKKSSYIDRAATVTVILKKNYMGGLVPNVKCVSHKHTLEHHVIERITLLYNVYNGKHPKTNNMKMYTLFIMNIMIMFYAGEHGGILQGRVALNWIFEKDSIIAPISSLTCISLSTQIITCIYNYYSIYSIYIIQYHVSFSQ